VRHETPLSTPLSTCGDGVVRIIAVGIAWITMLIVT